MKYNANGSYRVETHWQIEEVLDGDSIVISHRFTGMQKEIRLYGLDAPEIKFNRKMKEDEAKCQLPAQLLKQLGLQSLQYVLSIAPPKTVVTIITEEKYFFDFWRRQLGYIILPNGACLNDMILYNGYAKATHQYYCSRLIEFQQINRDAQLNKRGLYEQVNSF